MAELTEAQAWMLDQCGPRWQRPMDMGGRDGTDHSRLLAALVRKGLVRRPRMADHKVPGAASNAILWYPRNQGEIKTVRAQLYDVRAAPDLLITYDFERDGWLVWPEQRPLECVFIPSWPESSDSGS